MIDERQGRLTADPWASRDVSSIRFYLTIVRRRWWIIALAVALGAALGVAYQLHKKTSYEGHAQVQVSRQDLTSILAGTSDPATASANDFAAVVQTQAEVARSTEVAAEVVQAVPEAHLTYREFLSDSEATPSTNSDVVDLYVKNASSRLATRLTNAYAARFVQFQVNLDSTSIAAAGRQISDKIATDRQDKSRTSKALVKQLESKRQELDELQALQTSGVFVTDRALSATKSAPSAATNIGLGVLVGIVLAIILTALLEALDTRIRSYDELGARLELRSLGVIPPPARKLKKKLLMLETPNAAEGEAYRVLRLNLRTAFADRTVCSVMLSSTATREGKSTTAANLAVAMARQGARVVLVDLDLRKPRLHDLFALESRMPGVTDVVLGDTPLEECLRTIDLPEADIRADGDGQESSDVPRLRLLAAGAPLADPGEFTGSPGLREMIERLQEISDFVIVDSPPTLVSDPYGISQFVDGVVIATRLPMPRAAAEHLRRSIDQFQAPILGTVQTGRIPGERAVYYAGYGYGYAPSVQAATAPQAEPSPTPPVSTPSNDEH